MIALAQYGSGNRGYGVFLTVLALAAGTLWVIALILRLQ